VVAGTDELTLGGKLGDSNQTERLFFRLGKMEEIRIVEVWHRGLRFRLLFAL
jgi:hypothetical protein